MECLLLNTLAGSWYGVSGEAYGALHELEEFGLIQVHDPMTTRKKGKFTPPSVDEREAFREAGFAFSPVPISCVRRRTPSQRSPSTRLHMCWRRRHFRPG